MTMEQQGSTLNLTLKSIEKYDGNSVVGVLLEGICCVYGIQQQQHQQKVTLQP